MSTPSLATPTKLSTPSKKTPSSAMSPSSGPKSDGPNTSVSKPSDSIILEEEIDPNYVPTENEVLEYATWLGMDLEKDRDLFFIAREGLKAPLPENWKPCKTTGEPSVPSLAFPLSIPNAYFARTAIGPN
jgi:hypothetical protein